MYLLTAVINKICLNDVLSDLKAEGIEGLTVSEVTGKGGLVFIHDNGETDLDENIKLDIVVSNEKYKELAKEIIRSNARDLHTGSGKMWVTPVLEVERIRTGEINESALKHPSAKKGSVYQENYYNILDTPAS